jgi:hypothetical protein
MWLSPDMATAGQGHPLVSNIVNEEHTVTQDKREPFKLKEETRTSIKKYENIKLMNMKLQSR